MAVFWSTSRTFCLRTRARSEVPRNLCPTWDWSHTEPTGRWGWKYRQCILEVQEVPDGLELQYWKYSKFWKDGLKTCSQRTSCCTTSATIQKRKSVWRPSVKKWVSFSIIKILCDKTTFAGIQAYDIVSTLQYLGMIKYWRGKHVILRKEDVIADYMGRVRSRPRDKVTPVCNVNQNLTKILILTFSSHIIAS